ncbi:hypothetical protein FQN60_002428, partial [Etheostoma spectabile]
MKKLSFLFCLSDMNAQAHAVVRGTAEVTVGAPGLVEMIDTYDRPGSAVALGTYADAGVYADGFEDKPGKRIPKAGVYAGAGVGLARAEWSIFEAEAKGPNASAGVGASAASLSARAFAKAEVASASAAAGPVKATVGLAVDTGVGVGPTGLEAKVLGTGVSIGRNTGVSFLGTGVEFNFYQCGHQVGKLSGVSQARGEGHLAGKEGAHLLWKTSQEGRGHAGRVDDAASVSVCVRLVFPHRTHSQADHVK